ncbi:hypothetical protein SSX86_017628 [Deinandra increscens subsp. villosa]|uniref:RRM domain-containing protein n=1 Tax=Deinandra increscens subsp. villosa TaxID=3103831 RepID=A0AAP0CX88_9ASTR
MGDYGRSRVSKLGSSNDQEEWQWMFPKSRKRSAGVNTQAKRGRVHVSNPNYGDLKKVTTSIFITNFPPNSSVHEIWKHVERWGKIADVYISPRLTKSGRKFGFVRFVGITDVRRLIMDLRTVWIGSYHLFADLVKDTDQAHTVKHIDPPKYVSQTNKPIKNAVKDTSFAELLKNGSQRRISSKPVLPERKVVSIPISDCIDVKRANFIMGKVVDPSSIPNLPLLFAKEGFLDVSFRYIEGRWIGLAFPNTELALKFDSCLALKGCFSSLQILSSSFIPDERCVWVDFIGLPVVATTPAVLKRIGHLWGEFMFFGDDEDEPLASGKVCIITKIKSPINEPVLVDIEGHSFEVWAKEFANWAPTMQSVIDSSDSEMDDDEAYDEANSYNNVEDVEFKKSDPSHVDAEANSYINVEDVATKISDPTHVEDSFKKDCDNNGSKEHSPFFGLDNLEVKQNGSKENADHVSSSSGPSKPPGFEEYIRFLSQSLASDNRNVEVLATAK